MYKTINVYEFAQWFSDSDTYKNNFTCPALMALYDYLEEYEESTGEKIEFDPIALCCEYSEYESALEAFNAYAKDMSELSIDWLDASEDENSELIEVAAYNWLSERTTVISFDGGIIISQF